MLRIVDQGTGKRDFHALAGAETLGPAVEQRCHVKQLRQHRQPIIQGGPSDAAQIAVIGNVLAGGEPCVQAARVGQHAQLSADAARIAADIESADRNAAGIGFDQRADQAQSGGLAGSVGTEQRGNRAVGCVETDVHHCGDLRATALHAGAERLGKMACLDHRRALGGGCFDRLEEARGRQFLEAISVEVDEVTFPDETRDQAWGATPVR